MVYVQSRPDLGLCRTYKDISRYLLYIYTRRRNYIKSISCRSHKNPRPKKEGHQGGETREKIAERRQREKLGEERKGGEGVKRRGERGRKIEILTT